MTKKTMVPVLDERTNKIGYMMMSERLYKEIVGAAREMNEADSAPKEWVCADCGLETNEDSGPCANCGSARIVLQSMAEELLGSDWRKAFD